MNEENILYLVIAIISTISAVLAWFVKLRWSNEFISSKNEMIKSKEAQITTLENEIRFWKEINSPEIHNYYKNMKAELENFIKARDEQILLFRKEIESRDKNLSKLQKEWNLQKEIINSELMHGIDTTLESWVKSLEIRNQETEGHTNRLIDLTVKLAKELGVSENDLLHIRRGALLHDIGKIGIPDNLLNKPSPLTEEEWEIYKKHPQFAFDLLNKVDYLRPALEIPYCHHEKWDGSGYPRGLKEKEIPFSARIFSIIDVWEALTSDRPYRMGYSKENTIKFIRESSAKYFDPEIVNAFIRMIEKI